MNYHNFVIKIKQVCDKRNIDIIRVDTLGLRCKIKNIEAQERHNYHKNIKINNLDITFKYFLNNCEIKMSKHQKP